MARYICMARYHDDLDYDYHGEEYFDEKEIYIETDMSPAKIAKYLDKHSTEYGSDHFEVPDVYGANVTSVITEDSFFMKYSYGCEYAEIKIIKLKDENLIRI